MDIPKHFNCHFGLHSISAEMGGTLNRPELSNKIQRGNVIKTLKQTKAEHRSTWISLTWIPTQSRVFILTEPLLYSQVTCTNSIQNHTEQESAFDTQGNPPIPDWTIRWNSQDLCGVWNSAEQFRPSNHSFGRSRDSWPRQRIISRVFSWI